MRQTIKEIEVNVAYRWFLGLDMLDPVPHFSTFGKNFHLIDTSVIFIDSTHVKDCINSKKMRNRVAHQEALWFEEELKKEIDEDRKNHGKKPLQDKDDNDNNPPSSDGGSAKEKEQKCSTTDPDSGWFHKGKHKQVFSCISSITRNKGFRILGVIECGYLLQDMMVEAIADKPLCTSLEEPDFKDSAQFMLTADNGAGILGDVSYAIPDGIEFGLPYYWQFCI